MVRRERPGMGLVLVCVGALLMVIALFLPWVSAGLIEWPSENPVAEPDRAGLFSMVSTVRDATEGARRAPNPGTISSLVFGWLLVVLTAVSILLAVISAIGLRRKVLTTFARALAVVVAAVVVVVCLAGMFDIGAAVPDGPAGETTASPSFQDSDSDSVVSRVVADIGFLLWLPGAFVLALGGLLGPRLTFLLPGDDLAGRVLLRTGQPLPSGVPLQFASQALRHTTTVWAILLTTVGALLCFAGFAFLPWAEDVSFNDIGEVARDEGFTDHVYSEAYFGWLGWVLLALLVVVMVLVVLGVRPFGIRPHRARPIVATTAFLALVAHFGMLIDLDAVGADLGVAVWTVTLGFLASAIGALLPLRIRVRKLVGTGW
ncbi:MAG TPA: hypothetical protein VIR30_04255 [Nocardioides sp.]